VHYRVHNDKKLTKNMVETSERVVEGPPLLLLLLLFAFPFAHYFLPFLRSAHTHTHTRARAPLPRSARAPSPIHTQHSTTCLAQWLRRGRPGRPWCSDDRKSPAAWRAMVCGERPFEAARGMARAGRRPGPGAPRRAGLPCRVEVVARVHLHDLGDDAGLRGEVEGSLRSVS